MRVTAIALTSLVCLGATSAARAEVEKQKILDTVRAAFDAYQSLPCVGLKFEYKGDPPSLPTEELGAIVVYFGDDRKGKSSAWTGGDRAYLAHSETGNPENRISKAWIGFNAAHWWWTITDPADPDKIDMQTALMKLIPGALGYYVGDDIVSKSVDIVQGVVDRSLGALQELGAKAVYFDDQANGCAEARPADPVDCDEVSAPDAGVAEGDAGASAADPLVCLFRDPKGVRSFHWEGDTISYYVFVPEDGKLPGGSGGSGGSGADGGTTGGDGGAGGDGGTSNSSCGSDGQCGAGEVCRQGICVAQNGGCCRFAHTREENLTYGALIALLMVVFVRRVRRRARS